MSIVNKIINPVFIGHGSPMNAIAQNRYSQFLRLYAQSIAKPKAIVVISAHWQTKGTFITGNNAPPQIYDFYGFPQELYKVKYAPIGSKTTAQLISSNIQEIEIDLHRGIDHAGWAVVKHMFPNGDIPLLQLSLDKSKTPREHYQLGKKLKTMLDTDILFIGSGNIIHNLGDITFDEDAEPFTWAQEADNWIKSTISNNQINQLIDYDQFFLNYKRSIPTNEHYLPFLYILGMHDESTKIRTIYDEIQNGSISMRSIEITM